MPATRLTQRRTKVVCTLGPATHANQVFYDLIRSGMNIARFNLSHGTHAEHAEMIETVRMMSKEATAHSMT